MSAPWAGSLEAYQNIPPNAPHNLEPINVLTRILKDTLGFTTEQVRILYEYIYKKTRYSTILEVYEDKRAVSVEIQDSCELHWYIFCR